MDWSWAVSAGLSHREVRGRRSTPSIHSWLRMEYFKGCRARVVQLNKWPWPLGRSAHRSTSCNLSLTSWRRGVMARWLVKRELGQSSSTTKSAVWLAILSAIPARNHLLHPTGLYDAVRNVEATSYEASSE